MSYMIAYTPSAMATECLSIQKTLPRVDKDKKQAATVEKKSRRKAVFKKIVSIVKSSKTDVSVPLAVDRVQATHPGNDPKTSTVDPSSSSSSVPASVESVQDGATTDTPPTSPTSSEEPIPDSSCEVTDVAPIVTESVDIPFPLPEYPPEWYKLHAAPLKPRDPASPPLKQHRLKASRPQDGQPRTRQLRAKDRSLRAQAPKVKNEQIEVLPPRATHLAPIREETASIPTEMCAPVSQAVVAGLSDTTNFVANGVQLGHGAMGAIPFPSEETTSETDLKKDAPRGHRARTTGATSKNAGLDKAQVQVAKKKAYTRDEGNGRGNQKRRTYSSPCQRIAMKAQATCTVAQVHPQLY